MALDDRVLDNGHNVWLKPLRFCVAFGGHLLTLWWLASLTGRQRAGDHWFGLGALLQTATAVLELVCIAVQVARGAHSHFSYASRIGHAGSAVRGHGGLPCAVLRGLRLDGRGSLGAGWQCRFGPAGRPAAGHDSSRRLDVTAMSPD